MGKKTGTIKDVARLANVSEMTVFRIIKNPESVKKDTLEKVQKAMNILGYNSKVKNNLTKKDKCYTVGVCIYDFINLFASDTKYFREIMKGIEEVAKMSGYNIVIHYLIKEHSKTTDKYKFLKESSIDGLIIIAPNYFDTTIDELYDKGQNIITVSGYTENQHSDFVDGDNKDGIKMSVEHLANLGHKRIAFIRGKSTNSNAIDRYEGFKEALELYKIPLYDEYIVEGDFLYETAIASTKKLFELKTPPTAIVVASDAMAVAVIDTLESLGQRVPQDIAVIGYDDIIDEQSTFLTTVRQPLQEMGKRAFEILLNKINGNDRKSIIQEFLPMKLIIRKSCGYKF